MAVAVTYPGVYIEEISSGVRTIVGVSTSVTAFVGWAAKGPTDRAELVLSWPDYVRKFGGLHRHSLMSYAVYHFFLNGGQRARVIRIVTTASDAEEDNAAAASLTIGNLQITAKNAGAWANSLAIVIKHRADETDGERFRLTVVDVSQSRKGAALETFENLSMERDNPRFIEKVIASGSALVSATITDTGTTRPAETELDDGEIPDAANLSGGQDGTPLMPDQDGFVSAVQPEGDSGGVHFLDRIDIFNLLCVPGLTDFGALQTLQAFCRERRAFLIVDCEADAAFGDMAEGEALENLTGANATSPTARTAC
jgi:uncharacterized protein